MQSVLDAADLKKHADPAGANVLLNLEVTAVSSILVQNENLQYDPLREDFNHAISEQISSIQSIEVQGPGGITGQAARGKDERVQSHSLHEITLLSKPDAIPANLHVDVSKMTIGDVFVVADLTLPEGCTAVTDAEESVISIIAPRVAEEVTETETDDSPLADLETAEEPELVE
jgi:large subunit ribosomal protein L25